MTVLWVALIVSCVGSYLLKLAGLSLPDSVLNRPVIQSIARYLPMAMLAALVTVGLFDGGGRWALDWRTLVGFGVAIVLLVLRQGFLVVFFGAVLVTAGLRLLTG